MRDDNLTARENAIKDMGTVTLFRNQSWKISV